MNPSLSNIGIVISTAMSRDLLFEDDMAERLKMPFQDRWVAPTKFNPQWVTLEFDAGSVLGFTELWQADMATRIREVLEEVGRICKGEWLWLVDERPFYDAMKMSQLTTRKIAPEDDKMVMAPSDQRKIVKFNFASRDDAMLVRMTIVDMRSVKNADSGGMPQEP